MTPSHPQYAKLAARLGVARRAYKRTGAISGAIVFLIEALGTIAIVIAADVMFDLAAPGRIALFAIGTIALIYFAFRHIVKPLLQPITDEQIALYLEQRNPQFEGALIAATEFGQQNYTGRVAQIVDSILEQAVARAGKFDLKKAIDIARLKKYGIVAAVLVGVYAIAAITMPQAVSRRFARAFTPWKAEPKEVDAPTNIIIEAPLELTLNTGDTSVVRGGTLALLASTSRRPHEPVNFHFRSLTARGEWKLLPMGETDQLNGYKLTLPDINEDLEYFIAAENAKSNPQRVSVYDPLLIKSYEVVTRYPAYLKFADKIEQPVAPDIVVPQGSNITVRTIANGPLADGKLTWENKSETPVTIEQAIATTSFDVQEKTSFTLRLADKFGQSVSMPAAAMVTPVVDAPPGIKLITPSLSVTTTPLGEIGFVAEVTDDLALEGAELVITRGVDLSAKPIRLPLALDTQAPEGAGLNSARAIGLLSLETLNPPLASGEMLLAYVEVRDRKGQSTPSDLVQIIVNQFESWAVYDPEPQLAHAPQPTYQLEPVLHAAWRIYRSNGQLSPNDVKAQAAELAATMIDAKGAIVPYFDGKDVVDPVKIEHGKKAMALAKLAHESLKKPEMETAVAQLRAAVGELIAAGVIDTVVLQKPPEGGAQNASADLQKTVAKMAALVQEAPPPSSAEPRNEKDDAAEAAEQKATAEALEKEAAAIADKLKKAAESQDGSEKAAAEQAGKAADKAAQAARKTKDAAGVDAIKKSAAENIANAAANLKEAEAASKDGKAAEAAGKAEAAQRQLAEAKGKLSGASQDNVNAALDKAEAAAAAAARKQGELMNRAEAANKAAGKEKKEQAAAVGAEQVKLNKEIKELAGAIDDLKKAGDAGALKADTSKHVDAAKQQLARGRLEQKVANAAVKLAAGDATGAAAEQKKIKEVLDNVGDALKNASGTRAGDAQAALKRAKGDADAAKANLEKLAAKDAKPDTGKDGKDGKPEDGKDPGKEADAKDAAKKELAQKTADELARLARQLNARDFSNGNKDFGKDAKTLAEAARDPAKLSDDLENVPAKLGELAKITQRVQNHLESEYQANLKSKELFAAQREDCPPQYRPLVNRYFETISTGNP